jgi:phosphoserine phosphatase
MIAHAGKFPLVCFDLDGTLVDDTIYIWKTFHEHFSTNHRRRSAARAAFDAGELSYADWFLTDLELLDEAGADRQSLTELISTLPVMPGALETFAELRQQQRRLAIISGSVDLVVKTLFPDVTFDAVLINQLHFDDQGRLLGGTPTQFDIEEKATGLRYLAEQEGISPDQTAFIGDNSNDIAVARAAGRSIAFNCKSDELARTVDVVVAEHDLRAILGHLD